jgi:hypothetical protein
MKHRTKGDYLLGGCIPHLYNRKAGAVGPAARCKNHRTGKRMQINAYCTFLLNTLAYSLKARAVEPKKLPLLVNGSQTFVSRQRLGKYVPAAKDTHATIKVMLEGAFSTRSVQKAIRR